MNDFTIKQNPRKAEYDEITEAVQLNEGYCPCELNKTEDTKCMCKTFKESQDTDFCHCGRFYKVKNYPILAVVCEISGDGITKFVNWYNTLTRIGFIVLPITFSMYDPYITTNDFININHSKVALADATLLLDEVDFSTYDTVLEIRAWADAIGKKVITKEDLNF